MAEFPPFPPRALLCARPGVLGQHELAASDRVRMDVVHEEYALRKRRVDQDTDDGEGVDIIGETAETGYAG